MCPLLSVYIYNNNNINIVYICEEEFIESPRLWPCAVFGIAHTHTVSRWTCMHIAHIRMARISYTTRQAITRKLIKFSFSFLPSIKLLVSGVCVRATAAAPYCTLCIYYVCVYLCSWMGKRIAVHEAVRSWADNALGTRSPSVCQCHSEQIEINSKLFVCTFQFDGIDTLDNDNIVSVLSAYRCHCIAISNRFEHCVSVSSCVSLYFWSLSSSLPLSTPPPPLDPTPNLVCE